MTHQRIVSDAIRTAARYWPRSILMMVGSVFGTLALTLVIAMGTTVRDKMLETVSRMFNASTVLITSGGGMILSGPRAERARLTLDDIEALQRELPAIESWDPVQTLPSVPIRYQNAATTARVLGLSERSERVWDRGVSRGDYFDAEAVTRADRVALIGKTVVRKLFPDSDPLEAEILIGSVPFRVVGVLDVQGTDAHGMDRDDEIVVPISTAMRRLLNTDSIRGAKLLVSEPQRVQEVAAEAGRVLRERHATAAGNPDDFTVMTTVEIMALLGRAERVFFLFIPLAAGVALLLAGLSAAGMMLSAVKQRTQEIGLRRAIGARPRDIAWQFLLECSVPVLAGGALGIALGSVGAMFVARLIDVQGTLSWKATLVGLGLSAAVGVLAGALPARRAACLEPAHALRQ